MRVAQLHRPLMVTAATMVLLIVATTIGLFADDRTLLGVSVWLKPLKFAISIAIYGTTIAWLLSLLEHRQRMGWWLGTVIAAAMYIEMAIICGQAAHGHQSHFNNATPTDALLYDIMGGTIVTAWLATAGVGILLLRQRIADSANKLAVRLGMLVGMLGLSVGFLMSSPRASQLRTDGSAPTLIGAHAVGVTDGGPGLPFVNWSTTGGDLRIGHFIGMHALQILPLFAFALLLAGRRFYRLRDEQTRARLVVVVGCTYLGVVALTVWQALRGQSVIHPDALTLTAAALLVLAAAAGGLWSLNASTARLTAAVAR